MPKEREKFQLRCLSILNITLGIVNRNKLLALSLRIHNRQQQHLPYTCTNIPHQIREIFVPRLCIMERNQENIKLPSFRIPRFL